MADKKISALTTASSPLAGTEVLPIVQSGSTVKVSVADLSATQNKFGVSTTAMNWSAGGHVDVPNDGGLFSKGVYNNVGANWFYDGALKYQVTGAASWYQQNAGYHVWYSAASGTGGTTIASFPELMALWPTNGDLKLATGNFVPSTAAKGVNFTANTPAAGMTSQLLNWYEEGTWTPVDNSGGGLTFTVNYATYTRIGRMVTLLGSIQWPTTSNTNSTQIGGVPFTAVNQITGNISYTSGSTADVNFINGSTTALYLLRPGVNTTNAQMSGHSLVFSATYFV